MSLRIIEDRIVVDASPVAVWSFIEDVDGWSRWNPLYPRAAGSCRVGDAIDMTVALAGLPPQHVRATVLVSTPAVTLEYGTSSLGGLLRGVRYVQLTPAEDGACGVANGERMSGPLAPLLFRLMGDRIRHGLAWMNAALKRLAEQRASAGALLS